jgi:hypothetical protein
MHIWVPNSLAFWLDLSAELYCVIGWGFEGDPTVTVSDAQTE